MTKVASFPPTAIELELGLDEQSVLAEFLDRYLLGWEVGDPPSISEMVSQHPHLERPLRVYVDHLIDIQEAIFPRGGLSQNTVSGGGRRGDNIDPGSRKAKVDLWKGRSGVADEIRYRESCASTTTDPAHPQNRLGDYLLGSEIGRGGMGIVYRARQLSLGRDVAIKTLPFASMLDPKQIRRFQNEAQAAAQLHHPNIVPVYAVGCERGVHYYSMQLIEGLSLEQVVEDLRSGGRVADVCHHTTIIQPVEAVARSVVSRGEAAGVAAGADTKVNAQAQTVASVRTRNHVESIARLGVQAAAALHHAHQCGVIHRDIKPSNLMIDGRSNLWITDFGLARCQHTTPLSVTGDVMGTLRYMSPEQASGRVHAVDHRSDIYSLGITLYELLTLQHAFDAPTRIELTHLINQTSPISPRKLNPAIPADLETIVAKAINREPLERYESAEEFGEDLQRFLRGEQPLAKRPTALDRSVKWVARHKRMFLAATAALCVLVCGLSVATFQIAGHRRAAMEASGRAEMHLMQTNQVVENFGMLVLNRLAELPDGGGGGAIREELLGELKNYYLDFIAYAQERQELGEHLGEAHFQLARVNDQLGERLLAGYHLDHAIAALRSLSETTPDAQAIPVGRASRLAALCIQRGEWLRLQHDDRQAIHWLEQAADMLDGLLSRSVGEPRVLELEVLCYNNLASVYQATDHEQGGALLRRAIRSAETLVRSHGEEHRYHALLAGVLSNSATFALQSGSTDRVEQPLKRAIGYWTQLLDGSPENVHHRLELAANLNTLGQFLLTQSEWLMAEKRFVQAMETLGGLGDPMRLPASTLSDLASVQNNLGLCHENLGQVTDADLWYSRSIDSQREALSKEPENPVFIERLSKHQTNLDRLRANTTLAGTPSAP